MASEDATVPLESGFPASPYPMYTSCNLSTAEDEENENPSGDATVPIESGVSASPCPVHTPHSPSTVEDEENESPSGDATVLTEPVISTSPCPVHAPSEHPTVEAEEDGVVSRDAAAPIGPGILASPYLVHPPSEVSTLETDENEIASGEPRTPASPCPIYTLSEHSTIEAEESETASGDTTAPIEPEFPVSPCPVHTLSEHPTVEAEENQIASGEPEFPVSPCPVHTLSEHPTVEPKENESVGGDATVPIEPSVSASPYRIHPPSEYPTVEAEKDEIASGDATAPIGSEVSASPCPVHAPSEHPTVEAEENEIASGEPGIPAAPCPIHAPSTVEAGESEITSGDATVSIEPGISASQCPVHTPSEHPTVETEEDKIASGVATAPIGPGISALPCPVHAPSEHPTAETGENEILGGGASVHMVNVKITPFIDPKNLDGKRDRLSPTTLSTTSEVIDDLCTENITTAALLNIMDAPSGFQSDHQLKGQTINEELRPRVLNALANAQGGPSTNNTTGECNTDMTGDGNEQDKERNPACRPAGRISGACDQDWCRTEVQDVDMNTGRDMEEDASTVEKNASMLGAVDGAVTHGDTRGEDTSTRVEGVQATLTIADDEAAQEQLSKSTGGSGSVQDRESAYEDDQIVLAILTGLDPERSENPAAEHNTEPPKSEDAFLPSSPPPAREGISPVPDSQIPMGQKHDGPQTPKNQSPSDTPKKPEKGPKTPKKSGKRKMREPEGDDSDSNDETLVRQAKLRQKWRYYQPETVLASRDAILRLFTSLSTTVVTIRDGSNRMVRQPVGLEWADQVMDYASRIASSETFIELQQHLSQFSTTSSASKQSGSGEALTHDLSREFFDAAGDLNSIGKLMVFGREIKRDQSIRDRLKVRIRLNFVRLHDVYEQSKDELANQLQKMTPRESSKITRRGRGTASEVKDELIRFVWPELDFASAKTTFDEIIKIGKRLSPLVAKFGSGILCLIPRKISNNGIKGMPIPMMDCLVTALSVFHPALQDWCSLIEEHIMTDMLAGRSPKKTIPLLHLNQQQLCEMLRRPCPDIADLLAPAVSRFQTVDPSTPVLRSATCRIQDRPHGGDQSSTTSPMRADNDVPDMVMEKADAGGGSLADAEEVQEMIRHVCLLAGRKRSRELAEDHRGLSMLAHEALRYDSISMGASVENSMPAEETERRAKKSRTDGEDQTKGN